MIARRFLQLSLPLLASATLLACSGGAQQAEHLNHDGNRQYAAGKYGDALETYRRAEVARPDLPALNYNAGNALTQQADFPRAVTEDQQAVRSTDPSIQDRAYYSMGNAYVRQNQLREAADAYKSALRVNPSDMDAKYNLEVIQRKLGQEAATQPGGDQSQPGAQAQQGQDSQQGQQASGQGQQGAEAQDTNGQSQAGQAGAGQSGQAAAPSASGSVSGYTGSPAGQADALDPDLKKALDQFDRSGNVDDALRALDIMAQQERSRQAGAGGSTQPQGRDW